MDEKSFKTMNYYDGICEGYEELYHEEQKQKIFYIIDYLNNAFGNVLDLGSGDGVLNEYLKNKSLDNDFFLISCDLSFNFLLKNNNKNKVQCDIQNLPFKSNLMDYVISFTVIQDVLNPEKVIFEVKRVLKKNGFFILSFLKMSSKRDLIIKCMVNNFEIVEELEDEKDLILVCKNSY